MDSQNIEVINGLLITASVIYLLIILVVAQFKYAKILKYVKKSGQNFKEDLGGLWVTNKGGGWIGGTYHFRTPLPITIRSKDVNLHHLIKAHNRMIKMFWISAILMIPLLITTLNMIN